MIWVQFGNNPRPTHHNNGTLQIHVPRNLRTWKTVALVTSDNRRIWTFHSRQVQNVVWKAVRADLAMYLVSDVVGVVMMYFW